MEKFKKKSKNDVGTFYIYRAQFCWSNGQSLNFQNWSQDIKVWYQIKGNDQIKKDNMVKICLNKEYCYREIYLNINEKYFFEILKFFEV